MLFSSAVTLVLTSIEFYLDYRRGVSAIDRRLDEIGAGYGGALAEGLWNVDARQIQAELDGILRLPTIAQHISSTERRAMIAERETSDRLLAQFLAGKIGAEFMGRVSGVVKSGLFVRLIETGADGFIPASTIGQDYFRFVEPLQAMVGDRTGEMFRIGDTVKVRLVEAAPVAGALRFELLSEGTRVKPSSVKRGAKRPSRSYGPKGRRR